MSTRADVTSALEHLKALAPGPADDTLEKAIDAVRRAMVRYGDATPRPALAGIEYIACDADGAPCEWIVPKGAPEDERIVHLHGGSLVAGSPASHRAMLSLLAQSAQRPVLCVDYRLAPEHTYPAAHDDCRKALRWAALHGPHTDAPARRIALSGDSSGATLAAAACGHAIANGDREPDCLVLIGAVLLAHAVEARRDRDSDPLINNAALQPLALYAGSTPLAEPQLSPLNYDDSVLSQFPSTLLQVGAPEFLLYDSDAMAKRLAALNRRVVLSVWPDMPHVWHHFTTHLPETALALAEAARFIGQAFAGRDGPAAEISAQLRGER
jgi:acetyl esterase/lipase